MTLLSRIRSLLGLGRRHGEDAAKATPMSRATKAAGDKRVGKTVPMPPTGGPTASENVAAAARDFGLSRSSGETDAMGGAAKGYRAAKRRRDR